MTPCSDVVGYQRFEGLSCRDVIERQLVGGAVLPQLALKMEAA